MAETMQRLSGEGARKDILPEFRQGRFGLVLTNPQFDSKTLGGFQRYDGPLLILLHYNEASDFPVSFPHYFLKPTPQIAAQLKNREWIVARITSITESVVDSRVRNRVSHPSLNTDLLAL